MNKNKTCFNCYSVNGYRPKNDCQGCSNYSNWKPHTHEPVTGSESRQVEPTVSPGGVLCRWNSISRKWEPVEPCSVIPETRTTETDRSIKKYRINTQKNEIEWFTFIDYYPLRSYYVLVMDMYDMPQRMYFKRWEEMTCTDYEQAKQEYVEYLKSIIKTYKKKEEEV